MNRRFAMNAFRGCVDKWLLTLGLTFVLLSGLSGVVYGHAYLGSSTPAEGGTVTEWPQHVRLHFTEPVEVRASTFKVYPLDAEGIDDPLQLNAKARMLFEEVLPLRRDEKDRVDVAVTPTRATADEIVIQLAEDGKPGTYIAMWRVLSIDTHITSGFYVFTYDPAAADK